MAGFASRIRPAMCMARLTRDGTELPVGLGRLGILYIILNLVVTGFNIDTSTTSGVGGIPGNGVRMRALRSRPTNAKGSPTTTGVRSVDTK